LRTNHRNNSNGGTEARMLVAHSLTAEGADASEDGTGRGVPLVTHALTAPTGRGSVTEDGTGRGMPIVPDGLAVRRLTPRECERLQGLPDGWTAVDGDRTPDSPRYRAIGNGMAVPVVEWICCRIAERIMAALPARAAGERGVAP